MKPRCVSPYLDKYTELDAKRGAGVYISNDEGKSWQENLGVVKCTQEVETARYNNPQLFRYADGSLGMVMRASGTAWTFGAKSVNGVEWTTPSRFVAAPDHNFALQTLADGKLLMVRNARFDRHLYWSREGIYAYLSEDGGETWYGGLQITKDEVSINPVVAEGANGLIYIAYHSNPEGDCVNTLLTTSVAEIDAATANIKSSAKEKKQVLTGGKSAERAKAEREALTDQKGDWAKETIRLATYNIQYPKMDWSGKRMAALIPLLKDQKFDVFGAQEPFLFQIEDMMAHIGNEYAWIGSNITGDDNDRGHHFNPIFYRKDRVELLDYATVWLSDQMAVAGYGAFSARLFTWAKFRDKRTDKVFFFFNGHYDHRGVEARENASHIVLDMVKRVAKGMPSFVTADYNSGEGSKPYKILQSSWLLKDTMLDAEEAVNKQYQSHSGNYTSVTLKPANGIHIDHIFYTPNAVRIKKWELIVKEYEGFFGSDHLPIYVDCYIAN
jgi:endonuclease/exonuclease/phosphatase family metal-dependent hydrolase